MWKHLCFLHKTFDALGKGLIHATRRPSQSHWTKTTTKIFQLVWSNAGWRKKAPHTEVQFKYN